MPSAYDSSKGVCIVDGCSRSSLREDRGRRGYCVRHYERFLRHGDPLGGGTYNGDPARWIESHLEYDGDDCLIWPYYRMDNGYAMFGHKDRSYLVHRYICEVVNGPPPTDKHEAAHNCGKGHEGCVNPRHLRWATRIENLNDRIPHGTMTRGERNGTSKLTESQVLEIRSAAGTMSMKRIGSKFGVSASTVCEIINRKKWAHLAE